MNMLTEFQKNAKTMSTRLISELTEKRHPDVKRDVENMLSQLDLDVSSFAHIYIDTQNRKQTEYLLDEDLTMTLVTGYNVVLRNRVIKRWKELENQQQLPQSFAEALQLAADQAKQLELQAPKVNFYDKLADRTTLMNATQVAQKISMSAQKLNKILDTLNVYSHAVKRGRVFKQWFIDQGYGELKETDLGYSQAMFTTKGEQWVFEQLTSEGII
ncbi:hypothetical protein P256_00037 [Acinetobacter nectaris CIP 110549]|uniref:Antirepressor protein C-terminal domain-containing protein n=1 Tax=Acinetobacter nectaris CIP 110549 TaxID=1392540 RepID=V2TU27_9GAMM|nr:phage antirepressor KilAC domain-containing protein [Acinetobacter nectaris]ESK41052.1 hypothetical protein P256_00037 [Acinetobacter nectaris CIP 110549]